MGGRGACDLVRLSLIIVFVVLCGISAVTQEGGIDVFEVQVPLAKT